MAQSDPASRDDRDDIPLYPTERVFVLQMARDASGEASNYRGQIEHITSGEVVRFTDAAELMAFVSRIISPGPIHASRAR